MVAVGNGRIINTGIYKATKEKAGLLLRTAEPALPTVTCERSRVGGSCGIRDRDAKRSVTITSPLKMSVRYLLVCAVLVLEANDVGRGEADAAAGLGGRRGGVGG